MSAEDPEPEPAREDVVTHDPEATDDSESAKSPPVTVDGLSVSFGDLDAVSAVDVTVERGSFVGLIGPNGAGKTTVLRAIKGTIDSDAGTVRLDGDPIAALSAREAGRRVASVPQDTGLSFDFRVRHVVEMGRTPHLGRFDGHDADDVAAVDEAMAAAGVARFGDRSVTEVSGGERQRVLLARALAQETPALVLDEPTASLDVNHAVAAMELVRGLVDDGRAAIAAIHDLDMAARYCDRVVLLVDGQVRAEGPPTDVLDADAVRRTFGAEAFVGRNPATGTPSVTAFPRSNAEPRRLHVVGTGLAAARVTGRLSAAGHDLSLGVVPEGDVAAVVGRDAGATVVTVPPFAGIDPEPRAAARELAAAAGAAVVVGDAHDTPGVADAADAADTVVEVPADVDAADILAAVPGGAEGSAVGSDAPGE